MLTMVTGKAGKVLGFLRRNAKNFNMSTKELLYKTYVHSVLDYACVVWDPSTVCDTEKLERVQNLATRFVCGRYDREFSPTLAKELLQWDTLDCRRRRLRLKFFHIFHSKVGIDRHLYIKAPNNYSHRVDHKNKVIEFPHRTHSFSKSFFSRTIRDWNQLDKSVATISSNDIFFSLLK